MRILMDLDCLRVRWQLLHAVRYLHHHDIWYLHHPHQNLTSQGPLAAPPQTRNDEISKEKTKHKLHHGASNFPPRQNGLDSCFAFFGSLEVLLDVSSCGFLFRHGIVVTHLCFLDGLRAEVLLQ